MTHRRAALIAGTVIVACGLIVAACGDVEDAAPAPPTTLPTPPEVNIPYGAPQPCGGDATACQEQQTLDIYRSPRPGPNPVLVWIHGGGFISGNKSASVNEAFQRQLDDGWDIVAVNYRLTTTDPRTRFPAGLLDIKRAIRWIKANAAAQDWNAQQVAASGISAGGNLAEMLAVTSGEQGLEPTGLPAELRAVDSSVLGAVAMSSVSDMTMFRDAPAFTEAVNSYLGCSGSCTSRLAAASVQSHVTPSSAPILAIHGSDDRVAAPAQGQLLADAYAEAGIADRFTLIVVSDGPEEHRGHNPDVARYEDLIADFLNGLRQPGL